MLKLSSIQTGLISKQGCVAAIRGEQKVVEPLSLLSVDAEVKLQVDASESLSFKSAAACRQVEVLPPHAACRVGKKTRHALVSLTKRRFCFEDYILTQLHLRYNSNQLKQE